MAIEQQMHAFNIEYEGSRTMSCVSVTDLLSVEPLDLREVLPGAKTREDFEFLPRKIAQCAQNTFKTELASARTLDSMDRVIAFIGQLGLRPRGRFSLVDNLTIDGERITAPGITAHNYRQAFVIESNIDDYTPPLFSEPVPRELYRQSVAVREVVHLAGIQDILYFTFDQQDPDSPYFRSTATSLSSRDGSKGEAWEEGFASLCQHMYIWKYLPQLATDTRALRKKAPVGNGVDLPVRHALFENANAYLSWSIEKLAGYSPAIWDVLLQSRNYGTARYLGDGQFHSPIRARLKREVDKIQNGLFDWVDDVDPQDLTQAIGIASLIDGLVKKASDE